jgi:hypothetical protein
MNRLLNRLFGLAARPRSHGPATRLRVEALEARDVPDATMLDLTARGSSGFINDAYFRQADPQPTGSGHIRSFLRIQGAAAQGEVQQGYNTDARPLQFDENKSPQFTRSVSLANVPLVNIGGTLYREFLLDINQKSSQPYLSLDELRIYVGNAPNLSGYNAADGTLAGLAAVYDMDVGGDSWVKLNYRLNHGSGSGDMFLYVPNQLLVDGGGGPYLYLYSKFGEHFASNAGFQEWAAGLSSLVQATASISGFRFHDVNKNGVFEPDLGIGEVGIADAVVYLDTNNNAVLDDGEVYTITDSTGSYRFNNLVAATYFVRAITPEGWTESGNVPFIVVLGLGQDRTDVNLGIFEGGIIPT